MKARTILKLTARDHLLSVITVILGLQTGALSATTEAELSPIPPGSSAFSGGPGQLVPGCRFAEGKGMRVMVKATGILRSADGFNWQESHKANAPLYNITFGDGLFVAVGHGGTILVSQDGAVWANRRSGTPSSLHDIAYAKGSFIAVGNEGVIATSTDGMSWHIQNSGTDERLHGVTYGNGLFVAVGYHGTILTSKDGVNWKTRESQIEERLQGVQYGNGTFVAISWHGHVLTSKTGITWKSQAGLGADLAQLSYKNGAFVSCSSQGGVWVSANGKLWSRATTPEQIVPASAAVAKAGW